MALQLWNGSRYDIIAWPRSTSGIRGNWIQDRISGLFSDDWEVDREISMVRVLTLGWGWRRRRW